MGFKTKLKLCKKVSGNIPGNAQQMLHSFHKWGCCLHKYGGLKKWQNQIIYICCIFICYTKGQDRLIVNTIWHRSKKGRKLIINTKYYCVRPPHLWWRRNICDDKIWKKKISRVFSPKNILSTVKFKYKLCKLLANLSFQRFCYVWYIL